MRRLKNLEEGLGRFRLEIYKSSVFFHVRMNVESHHQSETINIP